MNQAPGPLPKLMSQMFSATFIRAAVSMLALFIVFATLKAGASATDIPIIHLNITLPVHLSSAIPTAR
ncbi:hypothetical protein L3V16_21310 [Brucella ciceri]|uniref:hypothetical protein n=1 Tax=Brucella ciceri TaxID=391287 RepID=UPI001F13AC3F|nr:hypothetical protein [Brucella ciceri]MCH6206366.1 hypothetical protein [Brucella ciceri]